MPADAFAKPLNGNRPRSILEEIGMSSGGRLLAGAEETKKSLRRREALDDEAEVDRLKRIELSVFSPEVHT